MKVFKKIAKVSGIILIATYLHSYKDEIFYPYIYKKTKLKLLLKNLVEDFNYYEQNVTDYIRINPKIKNDELIFGEIKEMYKIAKNRLKNRKGSKFENENEKTNEKEHCNSYQIVEVYPHNLLDLQKVLLLSEKYYFPIVTSNEEWFELNKKYYIKVNFSKYMNNKSTIKLSKGDELQINVESTIKDVKKFANLKIKNLDITDDTKVRDIINNPFYFDEEFIRRIVSFQVVFPSDKIIKVDENNSSVYSNNFYNKNNFLFSQEIYGIIPYVSLKLSEEDYNIDTPINSTNNKEIEKIDSLDKILFNIKIQSNFSDKIIRKNHLSNYYDKKKALLDYLFESTGLEINTYSKDDCNNTNKYGFEFYRRLKLNLKSQSDANYILKNLNSFIESKNNNINESNENNNKYSFLDLNSSHYSTTTDTLKNDGKEIQNTSKNIDKMKALKIFNLIKGKLINAKNVDISCNSINKVYYIALQYDNILEIDFINKNDYFYNESVDKVICKIDEISSHLNIKLSIDKPLINDRFHEINDSIKFGVNSMKLNKEIKKILDPDNLINPHLSPFKPNIFQEFKQKNKLLNYIIDKLELI